MVIINSSNKYKYELYVFARQQWRVELAIGKLKVKINYF